MRMTKDNVLLVTLKNNQHTLSLQLLPKSTLVGVSLSQHFWVCKPMWQSAWSTRWPQLKVPSEFMNNHKRDSIHAQDSVGM